MGNVSHIGHKSWNCACCSSTKRLKSLQENFPTLDRRARHVLSTCYDCVISWNCFPRKPLALDSVHFRERARPAKEAQLMQILTGATAAVLLIAGGLIGMQAAKAQLHHRASGPSH